MGLELSPYLPTATCSRLTNVVCQGVFARNFLAVQFFCSSNAPDDDAAIALPAAPLSLYSGLAYRRDPEARRAAELEETAAPAAPSAAAASGAPIGVNCCKRCTHWCRQAQAAASPPSLQSTSACSRGVSCSKAANKNFGFFTLIIFL